MYGLSKKQKLTHVVEKIKELQISSYEIGKKTGLSIAGIDKILTGTVKNPHESTLNVIMEFLESKVLGSNLKENNTQNLLNEHDENILSEKSENYTKQLIDCLHQSAELIKENAKLKALLIKNNIKFE